MANQPHGVGISGTNVSVNYAVEKYADTSGAAPVWHGSICGTPATGVFPFFIGGKITSLERNNNIEVVYGFGSREPIWFVGKQFQGSFSLEGLLSSPFSLISVFPGYRQTGAGTVKTHTFTPVNGVSSLCVHNYVDLTSEPATPTDESRILDFTFKGCVCTSCAINASVGEVATCKLDFNYCTENQASTASAMTAEGTWGTGSNDYFPYTFAHGSVTWSGLVLAEVQSVDVTINPNNELIWGFGSRMAQSALAKALEYDINVGLIFEDPFALMNYLYANSTTTSGTTPMSDTDTATLAPSACTGQGVTMQLEFNNAVCGIANTDAAYRSFNITFGNCVINTHSLPQSPNEMIIETVNIKAKSCTISTMDNITPSNYLPS